MIYRIVEGVEKRFVCECRCVCVCVCLEAEKGENGLEVTGTGVMVKWCDLLICF